MIAPDSFGETLTAVQAAHAIADGWASARPQDDLVLMPQSDGGPGFVDVLATRGGDVRTEYVSGPLVDSVDARWLLVGSTAFVEVAQACGLGLLGGAPDPQTSLSAHSRGVGEMIDAALGAGATTVVVGLGGSSCTDGGRGMVRALGGLGEAMSKLRDVELVVASDVENPLLGPLGAAAVFGPQKGADAAALDVLEDRNADWAEVLRAVTGKAVDERDGAGAAGGIGAALLALGGRRRSGAELVAEYTDQDAVLGDVDLVLTGEGKFDSQSLRGKLVTALASAGGRFSVRTVVLAGQVVLTDRQVADAGVTAAHSVTEFAGSVDVAMSDARNQLTALAARVASDW
ncbi:putative glycerate kinase [Rhodococcoides trifolii]|uniref:Glycerate kinase n=2 Tax=Rhodococcoides trifolii TaxID=908250 RepID=A0A917D326_9NOCA|nr:putative glycerate kinase [Rhodococcus trifolii]